MNRDPFSDDGLMGLYALLQTVQSEVKDHAVLLAQVQRDVQDQIRLVDTLNRVLRDGNGRQSLLERMSLVEQALTRMAEGVSEVRKLLESTRSDDTKGRWTLANSLVTGILALLAALMTALLTLMLHGGKP